MSIGDVKGVGLQLKSNVRQFKLLRRFIGEILDGFGNKNTGRDGIGGNMRYDVPLTGHIGGNTLDDEQSEIDRNEQSAKRAACCLIVSEDGKILAVSRRNDPTMWGMPGGKVDPGEDVIDAAKRELQEETGLIATALTPIFSSRDAQGFVTTTFACEVEGQINTDEEGLIRWVDKDVLLNPSSTPYMTYNKALFQHLLGIK